jgi:hypothetical protein
MLKKLAKLSVSSFGITAEARLPKVSVVGTFMVLANASAF